MSLIPFSLGYGESGGSTMLPLASSVGKGIGRAFSIGRGDLDLDRSERVGDSGVEDRGGVGTLLSALSFSGVGGGGGDTGGAVGSSTGAFSGKKGDLGLSAVGDCV